jgi:hypothetical protein
VPTARSVARALLAVAGVALVAAGIAIAVPAYGHDAFPAGLALGLGVLVFAAGIAVLGGAALLSGQALNRGQRLGLKLAGLLAIGAFLLPVGGLFVTPDLLADLVGAPPSVAALLAWLYLTTGALAIACVVALWWGAETASRTLRD